jgi:biotin carboxylase
VSKKGEAMIDVILVGNSTRIALPVLQAIHSMGDTQCAVVGSEQTQALRWSHLCRQHAVIDFTRDEASLQVINHMAEQNPAAILLPFDCEAIRFVNRVQGRLSLKSIPVPDMATLNMFDDKWLFHQFCASNALPVPKTLWVGPKSNLDFSTIQADLGLPFIIKPTNESGSNGVQTIHSLEELEQKILNNEAYVFTPLIAQKYIEGIDMDINLFSVDGQLRAVSIHRPHKSIIDFMPHPELENIAERICRCSQYSGVMNADVRLEANTGHVYLIESNPRFWATLVAAVDCGLNFAVESIQRTEPSVVPRRLSAGRFDGRHPLLMPSSWWRLVSDRTERGRLHRARAFDVYGLGELVRDIPRMFKRGWRRMSKATP